MKSEQRGTAGINVVSHKQQITYHQNLWYNVTDSNELSSIRITDTFTVDLLTKEEFRMHCVKKIRRQQVLII